MDDFWSTFKKLHSPYFRAGDSSFRARAFIALVIPFGSVGVDFPLMSARDRKASERRLGGQLTFDAGTTGRTQTPEPGDAIQTSGTRSARVGGAFVNV